MEEGSIERVLTSPNPQKSGQTYKFTHRPASLITSYLLSTTQSVTLGCRCSWAGGGEGRRRSAAALFILITNRSIGVGLSDEAWKHPPIHDTYQVPRPTADAVVVFPSPSPSPSCALGPAILARLLRTW